MHEVNISISDKGYDDSIKIEISDDDLKLYLDELFTAEELVNEMKYYMAEDEGIDPEEVEADLDDAYEYFIDFDMWEEIDGIRDYVEDCVEEDYQSEISQQLFDIEGETEPTLEEQFGVYGDIQGIR